MRAKRFVKLAVGLCVLLPLLGGLLVILEFPALAVSAALAVECWRGGLHPAVVQVGDDSIAYLDGGSGPAIVLVHGFGAEKEDWVRLAPYLTPRYRVIALDLPGFGQSTRDPAKRYDIASQAERLHRFVEALDLRQFHLGGNSMGAQIAGFYAASHPERLLSLALFAPGGVLPNPSWVAHEFEQGRNPLVSTSREDFERLMDLIFFKRPFIPWFVMDELAAQSMRDHDWNERIFHQLFEPFQPLNPLFSRIQTKTLVIWGDQDRILDVSCARVLEAGLPSARVAILKDCGHAPMVERPEESAGHYLEFLASK